MAAKASKGAVINCSCATAKVQAGAIVFDKILELLVVVVPVALGLILILVPTKREDPKRHMLWRFVLGACLIVYGGLTWWQQSRAKRIANKERESAIEETSANCPPM